MSILSTWPDGTDPFRERPDAHSGLAFAFGAGRVRNDNVVTEVAAGTVTLTDATTNFIEVTGAGVVSDNTTGFTAGLIPLFEVVTAAGAISSVTDRRAFLMPTGGGGGGSAGLTLLDTVSLGAAGTITFSAINQTHRHLWIRARIRTAAAVVSDAMVMRVGNGTVDSGASAYAYLSHIAGSTSAVVHSNAANAMRLGNVPGNSADANRFGIVEIEIRDYTTTGTGELRLAIARSGARNTSANYAHSDSDGHWDNTIDAINIITLASIDGGFSNLAAGSRAELYGIA